MFHSRWGLLVMLVGGALAVHACGSSARPFGGDIDAGSGLGGRSAAAGGRGDSGRSGQGGGGSGGHSGAGGGPSAGAPGSTGGVGVAGRGASTGGASADGGRMGGGSSGGVTASGGRASSGGNGGSPGTGGGGGSAAAPGSGGIGGRGGAPGKGGADGGTAGGPGALGGGPGSGGAGTGGSAGNGGAGGAAATCQTLTKQYATEMTAAKVCSDLGTGNQCEMQVPGSLDCGFNCMTVVNDSRALGVTLDAWKAAGCAPPSNCPLIRCVALQFGFCVTDATKTAYRCSDTGP